MSEEQSQASAPLALSTPLLDGALADYRDDLVVRAVHLFYRHHLESYARLEFALRETERHVSSNEELSRALTREADGVAANRRGAETWAARYLRTIAKCSKQEQEKTKESERSK